VPQRVPKELIDRLKADVSLQRLVEASGIELKRILPEKEDDEA
jgi:hypothetical protein